MAKRNLNDEILNAFRPFRGVYLGFAPTDESDIGMGELEISITESTLKSRMATGLEIQEETSPLSEFEIIDEESLLARGAGDNVNLDKLRGKIKGFKLGEMEYLFVPGDEEGDVALLIAGGLGDILGPTFLINPQMVERGVYKSMVAALAKEHGKDYLPRLSYGGKAKE